MTGVKEYSICLDCKYQDGTYINDYGVNTWCALNKTDNCEKTFECKYYESLTLGRPVFILPKKDIENEEEKRKMEWFELLVKAFDDLPKPQPVMCRCYIDKEELKK